MESPYQEQILIEALNILGDHENVFGSDKVKRAIKDLSLFSKYVNPKDIRWLISTWLINHAFADYKAKRYNAVPQEVIQAISVSPVHFFNIGVHSILFKSLFCIFRSYFIRKQ